jgi:hypothetical protein
MKTTVGVLLSWAAAVAIWAGYVEVAGGTNWQLPRDLLIIAFWLGLPLLLVVPLVHLPVLRWLIRRRGDKAMHVIAALVGLALSLPLVAWPLGLTGGGIKAMLSPTSQEYAVLYGGFGLLMGAWYAHSWRKQTLSPRR